jgi:calcium channel MID1
VNFNARASYGVNYVDDAFNGRQSMGLTGAMQDRYGNVWCSGPGDGLLV